MAHVNDCCYTVLENGEDRNEQSMTAAHNIQSDHDSLDKCEPRTVLTDEEFRAIFDREARATLGISGEEFVRRWNAREYPYRAPELADLSVMLPFLSK
jgi:hypothetical protein